MKKLNLFSGLAIVVAFIVAGVLVALGKYPVVTEMEYDELNQICLLLILAVAGLNFFVHNASFSPMLDRFHNVTRVLAACTGVVTVVSYFTEANYGFEARFFMQSSLLLAVFTMFFYFLTRYAEKSSES